MIEELQIGSVGVSVVLSILLRMIYGTWNVSTKVKPWIATGIGILIAIVVMFSTLEVYPLKVIVSFIVQGLMTGATATGFYEMTRVKE